MYFEKGLAVFMGAFVVWGFLMAMLFNLMLLGFKAKRDLKLIWVCVIMFISYFTSDHFHDLFRTWDWYLKWVYYDLLTLMLIVPVLFLKKFPTSPGTVYVVIGLIFNSLLLLLMHFDIVVSGNRQEWWFWSFYSMGINLSDLTMIVALIVDRDILGLIKLGKYIKRSFAKFLRRSEANNFTILNA
ncbi:hypothetical protein [Pseudoalteromonas pernae]|uniref:hypothetical protein n=1 Tax=Pseudoalteromonas pernae TaxID=3118054 RepID=UPI003241FCB7